MTSTELFRLMEDSILRVCNKLEGTSDMKASTIAVLVYGLCVNCLEEGPYMDFFYSVVYASIAKLRQQGRIAAYVDDIDEAAARVARWVKNQGALYKPQTTPFYGLRVKRKQTLKSELV